MSFVYVPSHFTNYPMNEELIIYENCVSVLA